MRVAGDAWRYPAETRGDVVVAIDGPAGAGKSTVARRVAERTGLRYLDTGATYRALTLGLLRRGVPPDDPAAVAEAARTIDLDLELDAAGRATVLLDGKPPGAELRSAEVNAAVSAVSAVPAVRQQLVALQRSLVGLGGIVAEGRDVGTVVWPDAEVKVYLTASEPERARRRAGDGNGGGESADALARRDRLDSSRATSPTRPADDAVVLDSTGRAVDQVVEEVLGRVAVARAERTR
ncbi:MAG TPA: (d)CMP kinase [Actinomycetes bacterium]|nr:(d)CMP kinase [Actinomycetes bacterium]